MSALPAESTNVAGADGGGDCDCISNLCVGRESVVVSVWGTFAFDGDNGNLVFEDIN